MENNDYNTIPGAKELANGAVGTTDSRSLPPQNGTVFEGQDYTFTVINNTVRGEDWEDRFYRTMQERDNITVNLTDSHLDTQEVTNIDIPHEANEEFRFTEEQINAYQRIMREISTSNAKTVMIVGPAGCGKSMCLRQLTADDHVNFMYITYQKNHAEFAKERLSLPSNRVSTAAAFCMLVFRMDFREWRVFHEYLIEANPTGFLKDPNFMATMKINWDHVKYYFPESKESKLYHVLCIDDCFMMTANWILLFQHFVQYVANQLEVKIMLLLCGDAYQLEPLHVTNRQKNNEMDDTMEVTTNMDVLARSSEHYRVEAISDNAQRIINLCDTVLPFSYQTRNDDNEYVTFVNTLRKTSSDRRGVDIRDYFGDACNNRKITYDYPIAALQTKPKMPANLNVATTSEKQEYIRKVVRWVDEHSSQFNRFKFYAYTNREANQINCSLMASVCQQCQAYQNDPNTSNIDSNDMPFRLPYRVDDDERYCESLLPAIVGMEYEVLRKYPKVGLNPGHIVTLIDRIFDTHDNGQITLSSLVVLARSNTKASIILIAPATFGMNLIPGELLKYRDINDSTKRISVQTRMNATLYGFPLQLNVGSTVHKSSGSTVECDVYANLCNLSISEIYVLLTRVRDEQQIQGLNAGDDKKQPMSSATVESESERESESGRTIVRENGNAR